MSLFERVLIGHDESGGMIFRIGPPGMNVQDTPEKDLIFSESYYGRRPYSTGQLDIPNWPGLGTVYYQPGDPGYFPGAGLKPGQTDWRLTPWMNTITFGKTFSKPPDVEFFRYYGDVDSVRLPTLFLGFYHPFYQLTSGMSIYYVVYRDHMRVGIMYGYSSETGNAQQAYAKWHGYVPINDSLAARPEQTYYSTQGGKIGWVIWDEL